VMSRRVRQACANFFTMRTAVIVAIRIGQLGFLLAVIGTFLTLGVMVVKPFT
jgi:hypothetical protein